MTTPTLYLTVDLEFFDSAFLYHGLSPTAAVSEQGLEGVDFLVDLFDAYDVSATWFVLGEVADNRPQLVRELSEEQHEIASHGYSKSHPDLRETSRTSVRDELKRSKAVLERVTGDQIRGFRAPAFAVDDDVVEAVESTGYAYDSSTMPSLPIPGFYGTPGAPKQPYGRGVADGQSVTEFPMSVAPWINTPISGAWMRLLGRHYALWGISQSLERYGYAMLYVHPWELVDLPDYDGIPRRVSFRTGSYARETVRQIVERWADRLGTVRDALDA